MFDPEQTFLNISIPSNQNAKEWLKNFNSFYEENNLGIENEIDDTSDLSAFFKQINRVIVPKLQQAFVARKEFIYKNSATNWGGYQDPDTILKSIHLDNDIRKDQSECYDILDSFLYRYGLPLNFSTDANGKAAKKFMESFILKGVKGFLEHALPNFKCINFLKTNRNISRRRIDIIDLKQLPNQTEYLVNLLIQADKKTQEGIKTSLNQYFSHEFLNIADEVKISSQDEAKDSAVIMLRKGVHWFNLADEGFGINMVFSVVLLASMANDKLSAKINRSLEPSDGGEIEGWRELGWPAVLVIEEPESNLHPALQSKLADVFVDVAKKFNTQFIIETHSEYLIRKLQYLTAKGGIKPADTAIYYFYPPDDVPPGEDQVKRIDIQEDGSLTDDFGTGFFDEADKIAMSIWNMNKSQKN